jgi:heme exporter protein D
MIDFFDMGGFAPYVWSAYGITLVVMLGNVWAAKRLLAKNLERLKGSTQRGEEPREPKVREL